MVDDQLCCALHRDDFQTKELVHAKVCFEIESQRNGIPNEEKSLSFLYPAQEAEEMADGVEEDMLPIAEIRKDDSPWLSPKVIHLQT